MNYIYKDGELYHYGIKGMRWGVRRYQNPDGSLTPAGKKRVSKTYDKSAKKLVNDINDQYTSMYVKSYNKASDDINSEVDKFNSDQRKKYGDDFTKRKGYVDDYEKLFSEKLTKRWNETVEEFCKNNKNYQKCDQLIKEYSMFDWHEFAKDNYEMVNNYLRRVPDIDDFM